MSMDFEPGATAAWEELDLQDVVWETDEPNDVLSETEGIREARLMIEHIARPVMRETVDVFVAPQPSSRGYPEVSLGWDTKFLPNGSMVKVPRMAWIPPTGHLEY